MRKGLKLFAVSSAVIAVGAAVAQAQETAPAPDTTFIFNTLLFLIMGMVVMFMAAGFCMLEAGSVRSKNVAAICLKNITLYSIAGIMVWLIGYNVIYDGVADHNGWYGTLKMWSADDSDPLGVGYSAGSDWFFQMVFVATAASIVSGTLAERIRVWPFFIFTALLTGLIYPIQASWEWGGGWLDARDFSDFAGSTLVHATGGWAALAGAIALGARRGRYDDTGKVVAMHGASMPIATLGVFILWLGWFGFNGGSQLAMGTVSDVADVSRIFANTNAAAAGGSIAALILTQIFYKKVDLTMVLNGALAGLVSITAEPLTPTLGAATLIGGIGGVIVVFAVPLLDKFQIDDVVGAIPVHLLAGIWGTIAVALTNSDASFGTQIAGVLIVGAFTFVVSWIVWTVLKLTMGIRVSEEEELAGLDNAELGMEAYPEFARQV